MERREKYTVTPSRGYANTGFGSRVSVSSSRFRFQGFNLREGRIDDGAGDTMTRRDEDGTIEAQREGGRTEVEWGEGAGGKMDEMG